MYEATSNKDVFPRVAPVSFKNGGVDYPIKGKDKTEFQRTLGSKSVNGISNALKETRYIRASDDGKAAILKEVVDKAMNLAKQDYVTSKGGTWEK